MYLLSFWIPKLILWKLFYSGIRVSFKPSLTIYMKGHSVALAVPLRVGSHASVESSIFINKSKQSKTPTSTHNVSTIERATLWKVQKVYSITLFIYFHRDQSCFSVWRAYMHYHFLIFLIIVEKKNYHNFSISLRENSEGEWYLFCFQ